MSVEKLVEIVTYIQSTKKQDDDEDVEGAYNDPGYRAANRFNLAQFGNSKSVSKGFANKKIAFYTMKKNQMGSRTNLSINSSSNL